MFTTIEEFKKSDSRKPISIRFRFDKIASSQDGFKVFDEINLNEKGQVAFLAGTQDHSNITGIFLGNGRRVRTIADHLHFKKFSDIALNDLGTVAFTAGTENSEQITGVFTRDWRRQIQTIADLQGLPRLFSDISPPVPANATYNFGDKIALGDNGNVLFTAKVNYPGTGANQTNTRLFLSENGTIRKLAEASDISISGFSSSTSFSDLQINDRGQTLYVRNNTQLTPRPVSGTTIFLEGQQIASASSAPGQPFTERIFSPLLNDAGSVFFARSGSAFQTRTEVDANNIYRFDTGAATPVRLSDQRLNVANFSVNDPGAVVFSGTASDQSGLFLLDRGAITRISEQLSTNALINNSGEIVYQPNATSNAPTGIFTRTGSTTQELIAPGDSIRGLTVGEVQLRGFNDAGQVAFSVNFTNGSRGVFRADPKLRNNLFDTLEETPISAASRGLITELKSGQNDFNLATRPVLASSSIF
ncbi:MAG: hypothetical protein MUC48_12265 [Leptolyngbya sp. Prado105]|jgi:hypothetical protein|nr:hypothetical protein [Leptolyngbya sp. Prado105]